MCLTNTLLLEQFDHEAISLVNNTSKKKILYEEFIKYLNSLDNPRDLEKVLRFATGSKRIPVHRKIMVRNQNVLNYFNLKYTNINISI